MTVLREWELLIDADQVLSGQGAKPAVVRMRSPYLVDMAERAIVEGKSLIKPALLYRRIPVEGILHERILLKSRDELKSRLLTQHLAAAAEVLVILCSIGPDLEHKAREVMKTDPVFALALDGLGSAAVEALANAACRRFEFDAELKGFETSIPLSPGMIDWPVEIGQPQVFSLLDAEEIGVSLTPSWVMHPSKALTMLIGVGKQMTQGGTTCDYCSMRGTCRYQDHFV